MFVHSIGTVFMSTRRIFCLVLLAAAGIGSLRAFTSTHASVNPQIFTAQQNCRAKSKSSSTRLRDVAVGHGRLVALRW